MIADAALQHEERRGMYKPGDKVAIDKGSMYQGYEIGTVERLTPGGQMIVNVGGKSTVCFGKNGLEIGQRSTWRWKIKPYTQDIQDKVDAKRISDSLSLKRWTDVPVEKLRAIEELLND
jgi:hypothetical protein